MQKLADTYQNILAILEESHTIAEKFGKVSLVQFGSAVNGLCAKDSSDLDLAFFCKKPINSIKGCLETIKDVLDESRYIGVQIFE